MKPNNTSNPRTLTALVGLMLLPSGTAVAQSHWSLALHNVSSLTGDFRVHVGETVKFHAVVGNLDDFGDSITVNSVVLVIQHGNGEVRYPNLAGNGVDIPAYGGTAEFSTNFVVQAEDGDILWTYSAIQWADNRDGEAGGGPQVAFASYSDALQVLKPAVAIFQQSHLGSGPEVFRVLFRNLHIPYAGSGDPACRDKAVESISVECVSSAALALRCWMGRFAKKNEKRKRWRAEEG